MAEKQIPAWLVGALSVEDMNRIEAAVKKIERRTSAEIVPMVVHRSTMRATGNRILFWISFALVGVLGATWLAGAGGVDDAIVQKSISFLGIWPTSATHMWMMLFAELLVVLFAFGFAWTFSSWVSRYDWAHRAVLPFEDQVLEAEHRAEAEFHSSDVRSTSGRSGVLLFVSMLEHRAILLADQAIAERLPEAVWVEALSKLLAGIKSGEMGTGFVEALDEIGEILAFHFPADTGEPNRNELSDRLRIIE
ncbi:MAG: hypothetical protein RBT63_07870 [Bdellovibrionales bacterium]|jgi:putative membrane protein|nr:hypothetical protein [Bdellovibrionales bacterium]